MSQTLKSIVHNLGELASSGQAVAILWDMDGTLVDTRPRMLASVHAYGRTDVRLDQVSPSWQETARLLQLNPERFQAVWQRVFWAYESFDADIENSEVADLARLAESLGVQTVIVTGRIEELRPVTERQLQRLGLRPSRVFLKSQIGDCTPSVKAEVIGQLAREGLRMGAFVTDSPEEIVAAGAASELARVFVQLEDSQPWLPEGVHRLTVPFRNGSRMAEVPRVLPLQDGFLEFGFEAEYEIEAGDALLRLYDPTTPEGWQDASPRQRADWVRAKFPVPHSEEFDLPLRRNQRVPELDFLPEGLFVDSDGNLEIVSQPTADLARMWDQIERLEQACGPALLQVTVSAPATSILSDPEALDGFLTFHHFLDIFERMAVGHSRYLENPEQEVLAPFLHPWLGPMTAGKQRFMRQYLEANARGERLDEKWVRLVDRAFSSFKYITGSAYRPALAGPDRVAIEIRDAHRNKALLAQRLSRTAVCLLSGLKTYAPFARTWAFDSESDYQALPARVRNMLEKAIPSRERPEIDSMYSQYDRVALQVYRNFAKPLKDYSDVEVALGDRPGASALRQAQQNYRGKLESLAEAEDAVWVRRQLQGALAAFAVDSGLWERLRAFSERHSSTEVADRVHAFLPLMKAMSPADWRGTLSQRLERLRSRWPEIKGLSAEDQARLRNDYLQAVAYRTLGVRANDRGGLELRFGRHVYLAGDGEAKDYELWAPGAGAEVLLPLSGLESYCLGRRLAAHRPCSEAAGRVSASGWLRHLPMDLEGRTFEQVLQLPHPESIETAAQVLGRVMASNREHCLVEWTGVPSPPLGSGFPTSLRSRPGLVQRLHELVIRWPGHAQVVEQVPFVFQQQSQTRRVLLLAPSGLEDGDFERFRLDYLDTIGADTLSFPCRQRAEHLRARVGHLALALSAEGVRVDFYQPPWKRRRMEAVIELEPPEMERLRSYFGAVLEDTLGLLGPITLGPGCRAACGRLDDNRPSDGGLHNCTTWVTLAPVCPDGRDLATLVEMPASWNSHDNPGWWNMFLTGASRSPRVHTVVYWTDRQLEQEPCNSGNPIAWDFNPH